MSILLAFTLLFAGCYSTKFSSSSSPSEVLKYLPGKSGVTVYIDDLSATPGSFKGTSETHAYISRFFKKDSIPLNKIIGIKTRGIEAFLAPRQICNYLKPGTRIALRTWSSQEYRGAFAGTADDGILLQMNFSKNPFVIPFSSINSITINYNSHKFQSQSEIADLVHRLSSKDRIRVRDYQGWVTVGRVKNIYRNQINFFSGDSVFLYEAVNLELMEPQVDKTAALAIIILGLAF